MTSERCSVAPSGEEELAIADLIEEFAARLQAGEAIDAECFAAEHPAYAEKLRGLLPGVQVLAELEPSGSLEADAEGVLTGSRESALSGVLGDFRIVREVDKGGMGIVYEAEQISLRRRVALKVLPFAATIDPRYLQRFHNEAQAAACLHHTNIVPVYFVGCERGVHFYAMQFIDGQPLSAFIGQMRRLEKKPSQAGAGQATLVYQAPPDEVVPTPHPAAEMTPLTGEGQRGRDYFRKVAELGIQTAEALDHAHQLGIVHRDIKPGNLMLDSTGRLWITDFGLAHMKHGEVNLTATGQAVGTPRYMSPEQALAKRVPIDHRTDVYSLGVTLYELLTLRPAFASEDRQELLRQIAFEDPPRPRRLERAIPAELEIIVLKAMEKRPQDRYATAQELADDLRRWLLDQSIRARRPSWVQVTRKWARRHQAAVRAASVLLMVLLMLGFGNALWWVRQQTAAEFKQKEAETEARAALQEAARWQQDEKWSEALSAVRRAQGVLRGFGADADLRRQVDELGKDLEMAQRLDEARLEETALKDGIFDTQACLDAYQAAFKWYDLDVQHLDPTEAGEFIQSRSVREQLVAALDHWASKLGKGYFPERKQLLAVTHAADPDPWRDRLRDTLEGRKINAPEELVASGLPDELPPETVVLIAGRLMTGENLDKPRNERLVQLLRRTQRRSPNNFWVNNYLGLSHLRMQPPRPDEAIRFYTTAVALRPQSPGTHLNLGTALRDKGQLDEAIAEFQEAIRLKSDYSSAHNNLGVALADKGQMDEAIAEFREALLHNKEYPYAHMNLGNTLREMGQLDEAIKECQGAVQLKKDFALAHFNLGSALYQKGRSDAALESFREAIRLKKDFDEAHYALGTVLRQQGQLDKAITALHEAIRLNKNFAKAHCNLGLALMDKGRLDEAIAEYREAINLKKDLVEAHSNLGGVLMQKGQFRQGAEELRRGHELGSKRPGSSYPSAQLVSKAEQLARLDDRLSAVLQGKDQPKDADERLGFAQICQEYRQHYAAAARFYSEAFAKKPALATDLRASHRYNAACAAALAGCGQSKDAHKLDTKERTRLRKQALDWLRSDLEAFGQLLGKDSVKAGPAVAGQMQHWLQDTDFAGVRGDKALAKLPEEERAAWRKLWAEVAEMLAKAQRKAPAEKKADTK